MRKETVIFKAIMKWIIIVNLFLCLISWIVHVIAEPDVKSFLGIVYVLSSLFFLPNIILFAVTLEEIEYSGRGICFKWAGMVYRIIPYKKIREIDICRDVYGNWYPDNSPRKEYYPLLTYNCFYPRQLRAHSICKCGKVLCKEDLDTIINFTEKEVYVTEEMYLQCWEMLQEAFKECPERLLIACGERYTKFVDMTQYRQGEYEAWK